MITKTQNDTSEQLALSAKAAAMRHPLVIFGGKANATQTIAGKDVDSEVNRAHVIDRRLADLVKEMSVSLVFKDLAHESLVDEEFLKIAREAIPGVEFLHKEYDAAEAEGVA